MDLTKSIDPPTHAVAFPKGKTLIDLFPSFTTVSPIRSSSSVHSAIFCTMSLKASATAPAMPVWSMGRRIAKSPLPRARKAPRICLPSIKPSAELSNL